MTRNYCKLHEMKRNDVWKMAFGKVDNNCMPYLRRSTVKTYLNRATKLIAVGGLHNAESEITEFVAIVRLSKNDGNGREYLCVYCKYALRTFLTGSYIFSKSIRDMELEMPNMWISILGIKRSDFEYLHSISREGRTARYGVCRNDKVSNEGSAAWVAAEQAAVAARLFC